MTETKKSTADISADEKNDRTIAALSYLIFFLPLVATPNSKFGRYHANQSLILLLAYIVIQVAVSIISNILPFISFIFSIILGFASIAYLVFAVMGILNASKGQKTPLPFIGTLFTIIK